jgi:enoyl-CoA hydratase
VSDVLLVETIDRIAQVTLHRPDKRNALNDELLHAIPDTMHTLDADEGVDVIVLTGADPAFCAGLDLAALAAGELTFSTNPDQWGPIPPISKPLIGAINGPAVTGGFELALACDFLIASEQARFADTHARVGVMPGWGLTVLLPQAIGIRRARQLSFSGDYLDARMAYEWGLVNEVVSHRKLLPHARAIAAEIASADPSAVRFLKRTYEGVVGGTVTEGWAHERQQAAEWARSSDALSSLEARRHQIVERGRTKL